MLVIPLLHSFFQNFNGYRQFSEEFGLPWRELLVMPSTPLLAAAVLPGDLDGLSPGNCKVNKVTVKE
jgi:hypothetical protein